MQYLTAKDIAAELGVGLTRAYEIMRECMHLVSGRSISCNARQKAKCQK